MLMHIWQPPILKFNLTQKPYYNEDVKAVSDSRGKKNTICAS